MADLAAAFAACERLGWAVVPGVVDAAERAALEAAVEDLALRPMDPVVGAVRQGGASAVVAVAGRPALEAVARRLADAGGWAPDEAAITAYGEGDGISPHRDNAFYAGFVAVVTLEGEAEVRVVADRHGHDVLAAWTARPGDLALFRGPRSGGEARPLHEVRSPAGGSRRVLVLRRNLRGPGQGWGSG